MQGFQGNVSHGLDVILVGDIGTMVNNEERPIEVVADAQTFLKSRINGIFRVALTGTHPRLAEDTKGRC